MKNHTYKYRFSLLCLAWLMLTGMACAQRLHPADTSRLDSSRFDYHVMLGTGIYSGWGATHAYNFVAPSFEYQINPRLKAFGCLAVVSDVNTSLVRWAPSTPSYAPLRNGTRAMAARVGGIYKANDHLTIAASGFYVGGRFNPLWNGNNASLPLEAYGVSVGGTYKFNKNSSLSFMFDFVQDNAGTLAYPLMMDHFAHPFYSDFHYRMYGTMGYPVYGCYGNFMPF